MSPPNNRPVDSRAKARASKVFGTLADLSLQSDERGKPLLAAEDLRPIELNPREAESALDKLSLSIM